MSITAERLEVDVQANTSRAKADLDSFSRHTQAATGKAGTSATGMGRKFSAASALVKAAAGTMVASLAGSTIMAASDLNEVLSKTGVVFGPQASIVTDAADRMAERFGMSKTVFLDAAAGMGLVGKAAGYTKKEAANLGVGFSKLAADAASFHNVPIEEALAAMKSGLTGEAEPLRRFGVLLSEAAVQTEAVRMGLIKAGDEMTEGQKVQARASLITKGMADAHGDLARTQGSVANRLKEIKGRLTNFAAEMGGHALPVVEKFLAAVIKGPGVIKGMVKAVTDWATGSKTIKPILDLVRTAVGALMGAIGALPGVFSAVNSAVQGFIDKHAWVKPVLDHAAVAIGTFVTALLAIMVVSKVAAALKAARIAVLAFNASLMANPIGLIVAGIIALAAVVYVAYKRFKPFRELVNSVGAALKDGLGKALDWIRAKWQAWGPTIIKVMEGLWTGIKVYLGLLMAYWKMVFKVVSAVVKVAFDLISGYVRFMLPIWKAGFTAIWNVVRVVFDTIKGFIKAAILVVKGVINVVMGVIKGDWSRVWKGIQQITAGVWQYIKTLVKGGIALVKAVIGGGLGVIKALWGRGWGVIKSVLTAVWNGIRSAVSGAMGLVKNVITTQVNTIKGLWSAAWNLIKTVLIKAWNGIRNAVQNSIKAVVGFMKGLPGKILDAVGNLGETLVNAGRDVIQGFIDGLTEKWEDAKDTLSGFTDKIADLKGPPAKDKKLLIKNGRLVIEGFIKGLTQGWKQAAKALRRMTEWVRKAFAGGEQNTLLKRIRETGRRTRELLKREHDVTERLRQAMARKARLQESKNSLIDAMRQGISSQATVLNAGNNAGTIRQSLEAQVTKVKEFVRLLKKMKKMGYSRDIIAQVASAGVEGGLDAARALVQASADDQAAINSAFGTINKIARKQSEAMGQSLYGAGIKAADGVIEGLKRKRKRIEEMLLNVAKALEGAIREALGIRRGNGNGNNNAAQRVQAALSGGVDPGPNGKPRGPGNGPGGLTPAALGRGRDRGDVHFHFDTHNPVAEPQSRTTNKALDRVAAIGLV